MAGLRLSLCLIFLWTVLDRRLLRRLEVVVDLVRAVRPRLLGTAGWWSGVPTLSPAPHPGHCHTPAPPLTQSARRFTIASNMVKTGDIRPGQTQTRVARGQDCRNVSVDSRSGSLSVFSQCLAGAMDLQNLSSWSAHLSITKYMTETKTTYQGVNLPRNIL